MSASVSEANDITIGELVTQPSTEARRLAADLPRGCDAVKSVQASVSYDATIWLADTGGDDGDSFHVPDGWSVERTFVSSHGGVALDVTRSE